MRKTHTSPRKKSLVPRPAGKLSLGVLGVVSMALLGCVKRAYNDSDPSQAGSSAVPEGDNYKNLEELSRETGREWVWMPASKIPLYSVRRCPVAHGDVAEYHLRRKDKAARWDPLWAVACIRIGKGQAVIHTGEINDQHQPSSDIIGTIHITPRSFGWRVPAGFVVKPGSGGCDMEYSPEIGLQGINPSLEGNLAVGDSFLGLEKIGMAAFLPYQLLSGKECLTITGAASENATFFVYHGWRTENFGIVERVFIRGTRAKDRFELKAKRPVEKTPAPTMAEVAASQTPTSPQAGQEPSAKEFPPDGLSKDTEGEAVAKEIAEGDLAAIWTNPIFRSWVVRDLRRPGSARHLTSLLTYPIIVETARYAGTPKSTSTGATEPNALVPPQERTNAPRP